MVTLLAFSLFFLLLLLLFFICYGFALYKGSGVNWWGRSYQSKSNGCSAITSRNPWQHCSWLVEERTIPVTISTSPLSLINRRKYIIHCVHNDKRYYSNNTWGNFSLRASAKGFVAVVSWVTQSTLKAQCILFILNLFLNIFLCLHNKTSK